jgi:peptidyl-prolyl cis-trans isomerase C
MRQLLTITATLLSTVLSISSAFAGDAIISDTDLSSVTVEQVEQVLKSAPPEYLLSLIESDDTARSLLASLLKREKLLNAAKSKKLQDNHEVQALIEKSTQDILIQALKQDYVKTLPEKDFNKAAHEYYRAHDTEFTVPEQRKARHILLAIESPTEKEKKRTDIENIRDKLIKGEDFATLAKEYSEDSSAQKGGDLGWIAPGKTVKPFETALFSLTIENPISPIVETRFGFHIIKLDKIKPERTETFDDVKDKLIAKEKQGYINRRLGEYIDQVTTLNSPTINGELLDKIREKYSAQ